MIDFRELPDDGQAFEQLVREILFNKGLYVQWSGRGADGGRDLLCKEVVKGIISDYSKLWLVQCKHFANSGRSVGIKDLDSIVDSCAQHKATGYLLACSTQPSSAIVERLEKITADTSNPLTAVCWDAVTIERLISTPRDWGIAQRFMPISTGEWKLYATEKPNDFVAHYKGYVFRLTNRIGSEADHHLNSISVNIEHLESIKLPEGHFFRPRAVWHDDKNSGYTWYIDYMYPHKDKPSGSKVEFEDVLRDGWVQQDGHVYRWEIKFVQYNADSDHYDKDHYNYYVKYMPNFLTGSERDDGHDDKKWTEYFVTYQEIEEAEDKSNNIRHLAFNRMIESFNNLPFLKVVRAINTHVEDIYRFERRYVWSDIIDDIGIEVSYLFDAQIMLDVIDKNKFHELLSKIPNDIDKHFRAAKAYIYIPEIGRSDEVIYEITLSLHPSLVTNRDRVRKEFNEYFDEITDVIKSLKSI